MSSAKPSLLRRLGPAVSRLFRRWRGDDAVVGSADADADDRQLVQGLAPSRIPSPKQFRHLATVLSAGERRRLQVFSTLAAISVLFLIGHYLIRHIRPAPQAGGTLTEALVGSPQYLNPVLDPANNVDQDIDLLLFRGLMKIDADLRVVPDLAERVTVSDDGKTYTVKLKPDLRWSDGDPLRSSDVKYTIETIGDNAYKSFLRSLFQSVTVETPDDRTVVFQLAEARPAFLSALTVGLLPEHVWLDATPLTFPLHELNLKPIGNGPYKFHNLTKDRDGNILSYTLIRNKLYAGPAPYIDKVILKFYPDASAAEEALNNNSVDALGGLASTEGSAAKSRAVETYGLSQLSGVFFNQRTNPALKASEVRTALALAVDRQSIIRIALRGTGRPIYGPILPGFLGYRADLGRRDFSLERAKAVLEAAGWKVGDKGIRQKGSQQLTLVLTTVDDPTYRQVAKMLMESWQQIGANVELKAVDPRRMQKEIIRPRSYEAILFGQMFDVQADPYLYWHSSQERDRGFNLAIFFNKQVDQDLEQARQSADVKVKMEKYLDFQRIIADEVPAIFLYQPEYVYAIPKDLRGLTGDRLVTRAQRFADVTDWYLQTRLTWTSKKR